MMMMMMMVLDAAKAAKYTYTSLLETAQRSARTRDMNEGHSTKAGFTNNNNNYNNKVSLAAI